ncbi:MAG: YceD family protein [Xenococcaceae cyanobacterium MO_207.B15]|nr:YceD family protein [Xenococcaceae cyanobacterium MO_207.B15]MDJ0741994.1 YceD family protein [Xenococcaceae cyanobacterium MO_167.B27]
MKSIYIPQILKAPNRKIEITINDAITGLNTLTPVRGILVVRHGGNFLELIVQAETIVTLTCDRCLQNYNHRLEVNTSELIWLEATQIDSFPLEREVAVEDLSETLSPNGYFDPEEWLYEQFSLAMPLRQLCGESCQGAAKTETKSEKYLDSRWASLASLKEQLNQNY